MRQTQVEKLAVVINEKMMTNSLMHW